MTDYSIKKLIETFEEHAEKAEKDNKERKKYFINNYGEENFSEYYKNDFNICRALKSICEEIKSLREEITDLSNWVHDYND